MQGGQADAKIRNKERAMVTARREYGGKYRKAYPCDGGRHGGGA